MATRTVIKTIPRAQVPPLASAKQKTKKKIKATKKDKRKPNEQSPKKRKRPLQRDNPGDIIRYNEGHYKRRRHRSVEASAVKEPNNLAAEPVRGDTRKQLGLMQAWARAGQKVAAGDAGDAGEPRSGATTTIVMEPLRVADLCAGLGGLTQGARHTYTWSSDKRMLIRRPRAGGVRVVLRAEMERIGAQVYDTNHNPEHTVEDVLDFVAQLRLPIVDRSPTFPTAATVGSIDVLLGGPPCQPWSESGRGGGLRDARAKVYPACIETGYRLGVPILILENVVPLLSDPDARAMMDAEFERWGYDWIPIVLDARNFGVCQGRKRAFALAFSKRGPSREALRAMGRTVFLDTLTGEGTPRFGDLRERDADMSDEAFVPITLGEMAGLHERHVKAKARGSSGDFARAYDHSSQPRTITRSGRGTHWVTLDEPYPADATRWDPTRHAPYRRMTIREVARLMGFADDYEGLGDVTYTNNLRLLTQAVVPSVASAAVTYAVAAWRKAGGTLGV